VDVTIERAGVGVMGDIGEMMFRRSTALIRDAIEEAFLDAFRPVPTIRKKRPRTIRCPGCNRMFNSPDGMAWHRKAKEH
jgi:hypothetical protein